MKFSPIQDVERTEEIPTDEITIEWVRNELNEMKKTDQWYYGRLFELYLEGGGSIVELSKKTTIPVNSVSRDINKVRKILRKKRNELWM
jgi:DNA-directed RNA polymerase specialized sigma24 family protein